MDLKGTHLDCIRIFFPFARYSASRYSMKDVFPGFCFFSFDTSG
ncbi:MAG: hypothetical protein A4E60_03548 [Syntrophorhabdus sp. PtaB.Bin047]|nr:MAG: hypothetical protein A4E60_03548 [Syntrophorhabdus sp. PtaB.Bin047]